MGQQIPQEMLNLAMRMDKSGEYSIKAILESNTISQGILYREISKLKSVTIDQKCWLLEQ
ncbi:hypothetical protein ACN6J9_04085 [Carnobacterium maltaromaticum]|uniref:hypothetical protein n=1 Tax=Carnobacterium maltaromaticum TaxID=2751 RepID=UPI0007055A7C